MSLPPELVDYIVDMLYDDLAALKACSSTCKSMLASSRRLIHQALHLTHRNNQSVLTQEEKLRHGRRGDHDLEFRFLFYMGERGLLRYTKEVHIRDPDVFTPNTLLPHFHYFQSLDRVHTLAIEHYDAVLWANHYMTCFSHFRPTLTSLTLSRPHTRHLSLWGFILQFPNLQNLCLEWLPNREGILLESTAPTALDKLPPLRGHLRLAFGALSPWLVDFTREIPTGVNFQSVELESNFFGDHVKHFLNACAHALQYLTIAVPEPSTRRLITLVGHGETID
jgi:hypothetical protein